jgi:hypothetical protein
MFKYIWVFRSWIQSLLQKVEFCLFLVAFSGLGGVINLLGKEGKTKNVPALRYVPVLSRSTGKWTYTHLVT